MSFNKIRLTLLSLLISLTLGGIASQMGLLIKPIAEYFEVELTVAAAQFSWLSGGILGGNLLALAIFRYFRIKWVVVFCNAALMGSALCIYTTASFRALPLFFVITGIAAGIGVCAASTIIAHLWEARQRQSILVAQDAMFNTGGMAFPFVIGLLLANQFSWSWGFLTVGFIALIILFLALISSFDFVMKAQRQVAQKMEWHLGFITAGVSLFMIIICQMTINMWLPTYVETRFGVSPSVSAGIISRIYIAALIGSLASTAIVMKINIQRFIAIVLSIGCLSAFLFTLVPSIGWATINAYAFGLAIAALYHSFIAWGISYIKNPGYRHVTFLYICAGASGGCTPYLSSKFVEKFSISAAFLGCSVLYGTTLLMIFALHFHHRKIRD